MKIKTFILTVVFSIVSSQIEAQNARVAAATKEYEKLAYIDAIKIYERVVEQGYKDEDMLKKLSNSYYFNADFSKAAKWYGELFTLNINQNPEYCFRYSHSLKAIGDSDKADDLLYEFNKKSGNDKLSKMVKSDYLNDIKLNSGRYVVYNAGINSKFSDYGASFYNDKLIFTSARRISGPSKTVFSWTNKFFSNLFQSNVGPDGNLSKPETFEKTINSKLNESTPVFTKDGLHMYFTRNNYINRKRGRDEKEITLLKLYEASLEDGKWSHVKELPFNSDQFSCAHPALSADEKTLYFASNMPGTLGESDLFKVLIHDDGSFGEPQNLGGSINTEGRETFPFISKNNELYFSSNGHLGLGGLDIFVTSLNGHVSVKNVGEPVNSKQDDFAFYIDTGNGQGFFSSNRDGGQGADDIYKLNEIRKLNNGSEVNGFITDKGDQQKMSDVNISVFDNNYKLIYSDKSDNNGLYKMDLDADKVYYIRYEKQGYETKETGVATSSSVSLHMPIILEKLMQPVGVGTDLASTINISEIYFDKDKWRVRDDAEFQLQKIVEIMKEYPQISIEIRSHTDSRQSKDYNLRLSNKRAKATKQKLIAKGITPERIKSKGFGESELINYCSDGITCSEEEHQANRRSEFVIISMK